MIKNRILYLTNHVTLSKFEIPMLQRMGYEVYMPKIPDFDISCRVDWELDNTLTIPQSDLHILNKTDFYYTPISLQVSEIINKYFDIAFMVSYPVMFLSIIKHFKGAVVFRAYGNHSSYTQIFQAMFGIPVFTEIERLGNRFWFGSGYETIPVIEGRVLRMRDIFLPLGLPNATVKDRWKGQGKRVLFPCPKINTMPFFQEVYQKFLKDFKGVPYTVCGVQPIPVANDQNVVGYLSNEEYEQVYTTSSCMYYYSQIRTHIHYTPAEAVKWGLPLVFMAHGSLDSLGGENLPGRCENIKDARNKIKRLVNGDKQLAEKIRSSQPVLLEKFSQKYCEPIWQESLKKIVDNLEYERMKDKIKIAPKKVAIILPSANINILFYTACALIKLLSNTINRGNRSFKLIFAYPDNIKNKDELYIKQLISHNIELRKFSWEKATTDRIKDVAKIKDYSDYWGYNNNYFLLNDGITYFHDCNHLLFVSNNVPGNIFTEIPYGVIAMDFMERHKDTICNNEAINTRLAFIRNSQFCLVTAPIMKEHAIQYAGIPKRNIFEIPFIIQENKPNNYKIHESSEKKYLLCLLSQYEDYHFILEALKKYYLYGGQYRCIICLEEKGLEGSSDAMNNIKKGIKNTLSLKKNINLLIDYDEDLLQNMIKSAECIISIGKAYGGNIQSYYYALQSGKIIFLSQSLYNNFIKDYFKLNATLYDSTSPDILTSFLLDLKYIEDENRQINHEDYSRFSIVNSDIASTIYDVISYHCCL